MLNQIVLVGKLVYNPELKETSTGAETTLMLAIDKISNSEEAETTETDFINVTFRNNIARHVANYLRKGSIVGVKGHLEQVIVDMGEGNSKMYCRVIGETSTFIEMP